MTTVRLSRDVRNHLGSKEKSNLVIIYDVSNGILNILHLNSLIPHDNLQAKLNYFLHFNIRKLRYKNVK